VEDPLNSAIAVSESLQQLILTPDYFCNKIVRLCSFQHFKEIDDMDDVHAILALPRK